MGLTKKIKVTPDKDQNQTFKPFSLEINLFTLQKRAEMNDLIVDESKEKNFSFWLKILKMGTSLTDEQINKHSTEEILGIANAIIQDCNGKKK